MTSHLDLDALVLKSGGHDGPADGYCVMEAVAYFAHEPWSDSPQCAAPLITTFMQSWNDAMSDEDRQRLKRFIPMVVGTRTTEEDEQRRAWMATDWLVRSFAPAWLDKAGLGAAAARLRALEELTSDELATAAFPIIEKAREEASAARSAAWSAAWSAARSAAWSAAWSAAGSAAWSAAWSAAESAARSAARSAAWSAARSAAGSAAWSAAGSAARSAARSAADEALRATVIELQGSAEGLLERMIAVGKVAEAVPA